MTPTPVPSIPGPPTLVPPTSPSPHPGVPCPGVLPTLILPPPPPPSLPPTDVPHSTVPYPGVPHLSIPSSHCSLHPTVPTPMPPIPTLQDNRAPSPRQQRCHLHSFPQTGSGNRGGEGGGQCSPKWPHCLLWGLQPQRDADPHPTQLPRTLRLGLGGGCPPTKAAPQRPGIGLGAPIVGGGALCLHPPNLTGCAPATASLPALTATSHQLLHLVWMEGGVRR